MECVFDKVCPLSHGRFVSLTQREGEGGKERERESEREREIEFLETSWLI